MRMAMLVLALLLVAVAAPPATAAPSSSPGSGDRPSRAHADRDRDGLSDDLEHDVAGRAAGEAIDVVVTFDGPGSAAWARRAVGRFAVRREFGLIRGFAATMTVGQARGLAARSEVFRVEPDFRVSVGNDASNADFGTAAARQRFDVDGTGTAICVVDTGVDPGHEQLDSKAPVPFYDAINGRSAAYDDHGHGTHVAATALGDGVGSTGAQTYAGVAPGAALLAAKVLDANGSGTNAQVVAGVEWCAGLPAVDVISMSLGTATSSDGKDAISQAVDAAVRTHGKVVVVAAGNSGDSTYSVGSPAAAAEAITVAAVAEWSSAGSGAANASAGVHLAPWSSRGPTADGRVKPDVAAPGMSVTSAQHGTRDGYVTWNGTSMATPFVAGTAALLREAGASAGTVKPLVTGTAQDRGPVGQDNDWGFGLLDGYAAVARAASSEGAIGFPAHAFVSGTVADHGTWTHRFEVTDVSAPVAATVLVEGQLTCVLPVGGSCWLYGWDAPDLDVRLRDPGGAVVDESACPLGCHTGSVGRQETIDFRPSRTGTYTLEVYPYAGDPNAGRGGPFTVDLSHGPVAGSGGGGSNTAPSAQDVGAAATEDTPVRLTLQGTDAETCELAFTVVSQPARGSLGSLGGASCAGAGPYTDSASVVYTPAANLHGTDSFTYAVADEDGAQAVATVTIAVASVNDGAPGAGFSASCGELDCTFTDTSADPDDAPLGAIVAWFWDFGDGATSGQQHPSHRYAGAGTYEVALTVTDDDGATSRLTRTVTAEAPPAPALTLSATSTKIRGVKYADLTWSGADGTRVDVYRDGTKVATTNNDGAHRDSPGKGGGTHTYRVCEEGSTSCSNEVTVAF